MDSKALFSAAQMFIIGLIGCSVFLFFTSGFLPENCVIANDNRGCLGLASVFPRGVQGIIFLLLFVWCIYLSIKEYHKEKEENILKKNNDDYIAKMRGKKN